MAYGNTFGYGYGVPPYIEEMFRVSFTSEDIESLREALKDMKNVVKVKLFSSRSEACFSCKETQKFLEIVKETSPKIGDRNAIELEVYYREEHGEIFKALGIDRVPTIHLLDGSIVYLGMPAGEEMKSFVETVIRISSGDHGLSQTTVSELASIEGAADIEVIVTPPCPYCPYAALLANMFAYVSKLYGNGRVRSIIVEAYENPDIADKYGVTTVPTIVVNGRVIFVGLPYEAQLLRAVKRLAILKA